MGLEPAAADTYLVYQPPVPYEDLSCRYEQRRGKDVLSQRQEIHLSIIILLPGHQTL